MGSAPRAERPVERGGTLAARAPAAVKARVGRRVLERIVSQIEYNECGNECGGLLVCSECVVRACGERGRGINPSRDMGGQPYTEPARSFSRTRDRAPKFNWIVHGVKLCSEVVYKKSSRMQLDRALSATDRCRLRYCIKSNRSHSLCKVTPAV